MDRILIVEDDSSARLVLKHIIDKNFNIDIKEATNGLEGLQALKNFFPDLILLDVAMPMMNGKEFLEAIRNDAKYRDIRVIVLTAISDKSMVNEMIEMGISDYILKPFDRSNIISRIQSISARLEASQRKKEVRESKSSLHFFHSKLLLVTPDEEFKTFVKDLLGSIFAIIEGESGTDCLQLFINNYPDYTLLGENLPVLNEKLLAKKLLEYNKERESEIFLCTEDTKISSSTREVFDGVVKKSLDPEEFIYEFNTVVLNRKNFNDLLAALVKSIQSQLADTVKQSVGIASGEEVTELKHSAAEEISHQSYTTVEFIEESENIKINLVLYGSAPDLVQLAVRTGKSSGEHEETGAAIKDIINTIANRMCAVLKLKGIKCRLSDNEVKLKSGKPEKQNYQVLIPFRTGKEIKFAVGIAVAR